MQYFRFVIPLILCLFTSSLLLGSCTEEKNQVSDAEFGLTAEAVPEGILISFSNIPPEAVRMFISVYYYKDEENYSSYNIINNFADIRDESFPTGAYSSLKMEKVKQNKKVIFPIVKKGQKYQVTAYVYSTQEMELIPAVAAAECIAENGLNFDRDKVELELNKTNSVVKLLSEPVFSSDLNFYTKKYDFLAHILVEGQGSIGVGTHHLPGSLSSDGLTWEFEPQMSEDLRVNDSAWLENGNVCPAWVEARTNIIYDDIIWSVEVGKTRKFDFSL